MSDLLTHNTLIMRRRPWDRILDENGDEIGRISETQKAPGRRAKQRGVYDRENVRVIELVQPRKIVGKPLPVEIADGVGRAVGRIVPQNRRKTRFALEDASGRLLGGIELALPWWRRISPFPSCVVEDATGMAIGRITFPSERGTRRRLRGDAIAVAPGGRKSQSEFLKDLFSRSCTCLEITGGVSPDLRLLMLGSAAGADLVDFAKGWSSRD